MPKEELTREEAVEYLTMQRDKMDDLKRSSFCGGTTSFTTEVVLELLLETGDKVGYTPAFRCLVKNLSPEESIRWGK